MNLRTSYPECARSHMDRTSQVCSRVPCSNCSQASVFEGHHHGDNDERVPNEHPGPPCLHHTAGQPRQHHQRLPRAWIPVSDLRISVSPLIAHPAQRRTGR